MITDTLWAHKVEGLPQAIQVRSAELDYLPPYSPDLIAIAQLFVKFNALLRKAAALTVSNLWAATGTPLERFEPDSCANHFHYAGFGST